MGFYDDMAATATELLDEFGREMVLSRKTEASYDPATGETTGGEQITLPTVGLFRSITADYAAANQVVAGDRLVVLAPGEAPLITDRLIAAEGVLTIVKVEPVSPAGTPVAYRLQVRG